jgi:hypothetical protein
MSFLDARSSRGGVEDMSPARWTGAGARSPAFKNSKALKAGDAICARWRSLRHLCAPMGRGHACASAAPDVHVIVRWGVRDRLPNRRSQHGRAMGVERKRSAWPRRPARASLQTKRN